MEQTPILVADINDKSEQDCLARSIAGLQLFHPALSTVVREITLGPDHTP